LRIRLANAPTARPSRRATREVPIACSKRGNSPGRTSLRASSIRARCGDCSHHGRWRTSRWQSVGDERLPPDTTLLTLPTPTMRNHAISSLLSQLGRFLPGRRERRGVRARRSGQFVLRREVAGATVTGRRAAGEPRANFEPARLAPVMILAEAQASPRPRSTHFGLPHRSDVELPRASAVSRGAIRDPHGLAVRLPPATGSSAAASSTRWAKIRRNRSSSASTRDDTVGTRLLQQLKTHR